MLLTILYWWLIFNTVSFFVLTLHGMRFMEDEITDSLNPFLYIGLAYTLGCLKCGELLTRLIYR